MKKLILIALICAGLMLVNPLTGVSQENTIRNNLTEKPNINGLIV